MPVKTVKGDIFESKADAYCNPVNCVGVMGKGLAKEFLRRFPSRCESYFAACESGVLAPGQVLVNTDRRRHPNAIFHVATKDHWRHPSRMEWIDDAVERLAHLCLQLKLNSIAIPALGCGNGGLSYGRFKRYVVATFEAIAPKVDVELYPPVAEPSVSPKRTTKAATEPPARSSRAKKV